MTDNSRPFLTGLCFDFALVALERFPDAELVCIGSPNYPDHVGVKIGDLYFDARGWLDREAFLADIRYADADSIQSIDIEEIKFQAGLFGQNPPYRTPEIRQARAHLKRLPRTPPKTHCPR